MMTKEKKIFKLITYQVIRTKTGLCFRGYTSFKGKMGNTFSIKKDKKFISKGTVKEEEMLNKLFKGHILIEKNQKKYILNYIEYSGSNLHDLFSEHYDKYDYIPIEDLHIEIFK